MALNNTGFVTPTATPNFDPGFVLPETQVDKSVQTFAPSAVPTTQAQSFVTSPVPTSAPISLAPFGAGLPRGDTSVSVGDVGSGSDGFGTAAAVGGGAALAALLNSLGQKEGGSGFSIGNVLGGVSKVASLGKLAGVDVMGELKNLGGEVGEWAKNLFDGGTEAVKPVTDAGQVTQATELAGPQMSGDFASGIGTANYPVGFDPFSQSAMSTNIGGTLQGGLTQAGTLVEMGGIGPGFGVATTAGGAASFGAGAVGAPGMGAGGMGAGAIGGAASIAGAVPVLALAMFAINRFNAHKDPTADTRAANKFENYFQRALQSPEQERLELENLKQIVYQNPASLAIMKIAARTADPTLEHTSGGIEIVGWKGQVPEKFEALLPELEAVAEESNQANYGGLYNIGDKGLMGSPPNPYGEETRTYDKEAEVWKPKPISLQPGQKGYDEFAPGAVQGP